MPLLHDMLRVSTGWSSSLLRSGVRFFLIGSACAAALRCSSHTSGGDSAGDSSGPGLEASTGGSLPVDGDSGQHSSGGSASGVDASIEPDATPESDGNAPPDGSGGAANEGTGGAADSGAGGTFSPVDSSDGDLCVPEGEREFPHGSGAPAHVDAALPPSEYNSRPPSSGMHCDEWGMYGVFDEDNPLPACNFVHNLEHGSIVLLYNCTDDCPDIVDELERVVAEAPPDLSCVSLGIKRMLITPYHDMEAKVAAVAWGFTWTTDCVDADTHDELLGFIDAHWGANGDAPEPEQCVQGTIAP